MWLLTSYGQPDSVKAVLPDTEVTIFFDSEAKEVNGNAGCNSYFWSYEVDGSALVMSGSFAVTEMWCGDEIGEQEHEYLGNLLTAERYSVERDNLRIDSSNGGVLNFERK